MKIDDDTTIRELHLIMEKLGISLTLRPTGGGNTYAIASGDNIERTGLHCGSLGGSISSAVTMWCRAAGDALAGDLQIDAAGNLVTVDDRKEVVRRRLFGDEAAPVDTSEMPTGPARPRTPLAED